MNLLCWYENKTHLHLHMVEWEKLLELFVYFYEQILVFNYYVDDDDDDDAKYNFSGECMKLFSTLTT